MGEVEKLPEVEVDSGEKDEKEIWKQRCMLYRFAGNKDPPEWVTRGLGDVRFLQNDSTGKVRLLLRENKTFKVRMNHIVHPDISLTPKQGLEDKAWTWSALDYSEEDGSSKEEQFCVRFKTTEFAQDFKKQYDEARAINSGKKGVSSSDNKSRSLEVKSKAPPAQSSSLVSSSSSASSSDYEARALKAEQLLLSLNSRLAEVENQLGLTSISERKGGPVKLGYWAIRGLAQPLRLLLFYLNVPFTERLYVAEGKK
jgi:hypothetical protein